MRARGSQRARVLRACMDRLSNFFSKRSFRAVGGSLENLRATTLRVLFFLVKKNFFLEAVGRGNRGLEYARDNVSSRSQF